jgi:coenzyme F420-reducing hydrogenase alpha subunit
MSERSLRVATLSRVEGEGALRVVLDGPRVEALELQIYEAPRFFEAFLRGRDHREVVDITSRICGICPVAYQTSAWHAVESLCGAAIPDEISALRRLLYCGEWISSHALHIYLLHAPDFLGAPDVITLARGHGPTVERGLALKKAGNTLLEVIGGRAVHPVNTRVGGFYRVPSATDLIALLPMLHTALDDALATVTWVSGFDFPDQTVDATLVALHHPDHYAIEAGEVHTSTGLTFAPAEYLTHVTESQVPYSNALHASFDGATYLTGPLARYTLNSAALSPLAREAAAAAGLGETCRNPARSIVVRAVETVYAVEEAIRLVEQYRPPRQPAVEFTPRAGVGHGVSEAPRGVLYHRYELDAEGVVRDARIVAPTSQNQAAIEADLRHTVAANADLDDAALTALCERTIRHYDPCISCATHFLELSVERK